MGHYTYTLCLNDVIAGTGASSGVDVKSAVIAGSGSTLRIVALSQTRGNNEDMAISQIDAGALTRANVVTAVLNEVATPVISALSLTADGRFLAVQTDSPLLAPEQAIDSNETRDIYLIDLQSLQTRRVTLAEGEVEVPVQLR